MPSVVAPYTSSRASSHGSALMAAVPGVSFGDADAVATARPKEKAEAGLGSAELAQKSNNPVANLISVPVESDWNFNAGQHRRSQYILKVKPVVPQALDEDWLWIHRAIVPVIDQPSLADGLPSRFGLGDITYQGFLTPAAPGSLIWGFGPAITLPTATDDVLGNDKWAAGPALVLLKKNGPWLYGALFVNEWQIASNDPDRDRVGLGSVQPFVNYQFPSGWFLTTAPEITANWKADQAGDVWNVPLGFGGGKLLMIGDQALTVQLKAYYNVHHPDDASNWSLQFTVTFLFPE